LTTLTSIRKLKIVKWTPPSKEDSDDEEGSDSVFLQAFQAAMTRYLRQIAVPPLLSSTGERLSADHPEVVAALAERERYWMSRPDHAQALANHRGFRIASNEQLQNMPRSTEGFSKYLAQFDILFSDIERRLWHMTGAQLKALPQLRDAPLETRVAKFDAIQWALARPQLHQEILRSPDTPISESIPAEAIENASIYWEPEHTNSQLQETARISREREIEELSKWSQLLVLISSSGSRDGHSARHTGNPTDIIWVSRRPHQHAPDLRR
jgi:hypothetical protein